MRIKILMKDIQNKSYQFPSDWKSPKFVGDVKKIFEAHGFFNGRMIASSKSSYRQRYPDNLVAFNSNIITKTHSKVFYGDIDLTRDYKVLRSIAECIDELLFVLYEMDCRFGAENNSIDVLISKSIWNTGIKEAPDINWYLKTRGT